MTAIFAKTCKGQEEIEHRNAGLSPRAQAADSVRRQAPRG